MILELVLTVVAFAAGFKVRGKFSRKNQCKAFEQLPAKYARRCPEEAYSFCESGFCITHCRQRRRCAGRCVETRQKLLKMAEGVD